jgi:hypothetical protein
MFKGACTFYAGQFGTGTKTGKVINLSVPLETIYPDSIQMELVNRIFGFFDETATIEKPVHSISSPQVTLSQNYPNPFNANTVLGYWLPVESDVELSVYSISGQKLETLVSGSRKTGEHTVTWDAGSYTSGVYFYKLKTRDRKQQTRVLIRKLMLIK